MPAPTAPQTYISTTPLQSYQDMAEQLSRIEKETGKIQEQRFQEVGTPAQLGALMAGRRVQEESAKVASVPTGDKYLRETTGVSGQFEPFRQANVAALTEAQKQYAEALKKVGDKPMPTLTDTPSWAKKTIPEAMPTV
jgi:hypothetical protein